MVFQNVRITEIALLSLLALAGSACFTPEGDRGDGMAGSTGGAAGSSTGADTGAVTTVTTTVMTVSGGGGSTDAGDETDTGNVDGPSTGSDGGIGAVTCEAYCGVYLDACADFSDYANMQDCMDNCGQWPLGTENDTAGDTIGCRIYHATVAGSGEPDLHCVHGGASGGGVCADETAPDCQTYCDSYTANCTGDNGVYVDQADCMSQCAPWYPGTSKDTAGNTLGCRIYHSGVPAIGDPVLHCPHAGPGGAGVCSFE